MLWLYVLCLLMYVFTCWFHTVFNDWISFELGVWFDTFFFIYNCMILILYFCILHVDFLILICLIRDILVKSLISVNLKSPNWSFRWTDYIFSWFWFNTSAWFVCLVRFISLQAVITCFVHTLTCFTLCVSMLNYDFRNFKLEVWYYTFLSYKL